MKMTKMLVLIICIFLTNIFVFADTYKGDLSEGSSMSISEWEALMTEYNLPKSTPVEKAIKGRMMPLNVELLMEKGIVVYGDHTLIANNDFKVVTGGYYQSNGADGEYRYHGYSADGGKHGNDDFPRDASSSTPLEEKKWAITPWENESFAYSSFEKHVERENDLNKFIGEYLPYTDDELLTLVGNDVFSKISAMKQIAMDGMSFSIGDGSLDGISKYIRPSDGSFVADPIFYANMQTVPTTRLSGQSIMFHKSKWDGKTWYQTFPMKRVQSKLPTPVEATIEDYYISGVESSGQVTLNVKVQGHLLDDDFFIPSDQLSAATEEEQLDNATRYHRNDIVSWDISLVCNNLSINFDKVGSTIRTGDGNMAYQMFTTVLKYEDYEAFISGKSNLDVSVTGTTTVNYTEMTSEPAVVTEILNLDVGVAKTELPAKELVDIDVIAPTEILDVWNFDLSLVENNVPDGFDRTVILEGVQLSEADESLFLSGKYYFPVTRASRIYNYRIEYDDGNELYYYASYVLVYDSVPYASVRVEDSGKINRKNTVSVDTSITPDFVEAHSNVTITEFSITAENGQTVYFGTDTSTLKEYLVKEVDTVDVSVLVSNEYGTRTYRHQIFAGEDYKPDLISIIWNNNLARNDSLNVYSEAASLDEDEVGPVTYEIFYDEDNDGIAELSVFSKEEFGGAIDYVPDKLGYYEIEFSVTESFGQETLEAYINAEDYQTNTVRREFFVDNLIPMTKVYTDIAYQFPEIDVTLLVDQNIPREEMAYFTSHNIEIRNAFREKSMSVNLQTWDLHTYTYSQTMTASRHTGDSYPPSKINVVNGGYTGNLSRYRVDNYDYSRDEGRYETSISSKTATHTETQSGVVYLPDKYDSDRTPSRWWYSSGGYTGWLSKIGSVGYSSSSLVDPETGKYIGYRYTAQKGYSGTVTKSTKVWVPRIVSYNDYYGRYSGTGYKQVKQQFSPVYQRTSSKYIVYVTDRSINNLNDLRTIENIAVDANVILVAAPSLSGTIDEDYFISHNMDTGSLMSQIIDYIKSENPFSNELTVLVNEEFHLNYVDLDEEGDPIVDSGFQYVHHPDYFNNSMGQESDTLLAYDPKGYSLNVKDHFTAVGQYDIYRRVKDQPIIMPEQGKYSNLAELTLFVHRKPIAMDEMKWSYDTTQYKYIISYEDLSYDPDFQYSLANRGIINRKMRIKKEGQDWVYGLPDSLETGKYTRELLVQDVYGIWSEPYITTFTLNETPPPQILNAQIRCYEPRFDILSIPGTEWVELYDIVTQYPYDVSLSYAWYKDGIRLFERSLDTAYNKIEDIQYWNNFQVQVPKSFSDGIYSLRLMANGLNNTIDTIAFEVGVNTPIDLYGQIEDEIMPGTNMIYATTSEYVDQVDAILFKSTPYEEVILMERVDATHWQVNFDVGENVKEDVYQMVLKGTINSIPVKQEEYDLLTNLIKMKVEKVDLVGKWSRWKNENDIFGKGLIYNSHRFLSLEEIKVVIITSGKPDTIVIDGSDTFHERFYTDETGMIYDNNEFIPDTNIPFELRTTDLEHWEGTFIIPLVDSTLDIENNRLKTPYRLNIIVKKGDKELIYIIDDLEVTGNTLDHVYIEPNY